MSTLRKSQPSLVHGFEAARPYQDSTFSYASAPPYVSPNTAHYGHGNGLSSTQMDYTPPARSFDGQSTPYLGLGPIPSLQIVSYRPQKGNQGTKVSIYVTSLYEMDSCGSSIYFLIFGTQKCPAQLSRPPHQGAHQSGACEYMITAVAPTFEATQWQTPQVVLALQIEGSDGHLLAKESVGAFGYGELPSQPEVSRKRRLSDDAYDLMRGFSKRDMSNQLRRKDEFGGLFNYSQQQSPSLSPYLSQQSLSSYGLMTYHRPSPQYQQPRSMYHFGSSTSSPTINDKSPQASGWLTFPTNQSQNPRAQATSRVVSSSRPSWSSAQSPAPSNFAFVRTTLLSNLISSLSTPTGTPGQPYDQYELFPPHLKATLEIVGDLDDMASSWSAEEWECQRRLVRFKRMQQGSKIIAEFSPVSIEETRGSLVVSCIYWAKKDACYITSVDTILLLEELVHNCLPVDEKNGIRQTLDGYNSQSLEALLHHRLPVDEKNRIRRNLEGFNPLTISKGKPATEDFFKTIMSFPAPKPRNIEKDIKVFPWKGLQDSLEKIIGKYSAVDPSLILPPALLLTPASSTGFTEPASHTNYTQAATANQALISPASRTVSGTSASSSSYTASAPSQRLLSPPLKHDPHPYGGDPWGTTGTSSASTIYQASSGGARQSWDLTSFINTSPSVDQNPNYDQTLKSDNDDKTSPRGHLYQAAAAAHR